MPTTNDLILQARSHIGTRFLHQGRMPGAGLDCLGLIIVSLAALGVHTQDDTSYGRMPDPVKLKRELDARMIVDDEVTIMPGRIGLFWISRPSHATHLAIINENGGIIHSYQDARCVVETSMGEYWTKRLAFTYKIPGVD